VIVLALLFVFILPPLFPLEYGKRTIIPEFVSYKPAEESGQFVEVTILYVICSFDITTTRQHKADRTVLFESKSTTTYYLFLTEQGEIGAFADTGSQAESVLSHFGLFDDSSLTAPKPMNVRGKTYAFPSDISTAFSSDELLKRVSQLGDNKDDKDLLRDALIGSKEERQSKQELLKRIKNMRYIVLGEESYEEKYLISGNQTMHDLEEYFQYALFILVILLPFAIKHYKTRVDKFIIDRKLV